MNHDMTLCADRDEHCPKCCFYDELSQNYAENRNDFMHEPISWAHFRGMFGCPREKTEVKP